MLVQLYEMIPLMSLTVCGSDVQADVRLFRTDVQERRSKVGCDSL